MDVKKLEDHIATLATLQESSAPMISCYVNLEARSPGYREIFEQRLRVLRSSMREPERSQFEAALMPVEGLLGAKQNGAASLAIFSRAGSERFFLALQFRVPLPTFVSVDSTPNIYHLVEIKDNYHRYVVLLATEESARILGINLGSITEEVWNSRPELRRRVGNEWTREHFQDHRRERTKQFIREQIRIADQLMATGGYGHLILAGPARTTAAIRQALPKHLTAKLVDVVSASAEDRITDVVTATVQSFLEHEEQESLAIVDQLLKQLRTHGLAVAGTMASMAALEAGQVDVLVLAKDYQPGQGCKCLFCGLFDPTNSQTGACPDCKMGRWRRFEIKEEMARLAERLGCGVEVVEHSDTLMALEGVGCLLRYASPVKYFKSAA